MFRSFSNLGFMGFAEGGRVVSLSPPRAQVTARFRLLGFRMLRWVSGLSGGRVQCLGEASSLSCIKLYPRSLECLKL